MSDLHEPRSHTVLRHVQAHLLASSISVETYAEEVRALYHARVTDPKARVMQFHSGGDAIKDMKANGQLIARILHRTVKMPVDLEEALVLALPEQPRGACLRELAERYDLLPAAIPHPTPSDDAANLSGILKETGEAIQALGPIMADGRVDEHDAPHAKRALIEINEALAALVTMQARITAILPEGVEPPPCPQLKVVG